MSIIGIAFRRHGGQRMALIFKGVVVVGEVSICWSGCRWRSPGHQRARPLKPSPHKYALKRSMSQKIRVLGCPRNENFIILVFGIWYLAFSSCRVDFNRPGGIASRMNSTTAIQRHPAQGNKSRCPSGTPLGRMRHDREVIHSGLRWLGCSAIEPLAEYRVTQMADQPNLISRIPIGACCNSRLTPQCRSDR